MNAQRQNDPDTLSPDGSRKLAKSPAGHRSNAKIDPYQRFAVIRDYGRGEEQVTFNELRTMFLPEQKHVEQGKDEMATVMRLEKKYGIRLEWRESIAGTHFGWFIKKEVEHG